jgi:hypothetical protein
MRLLSIAVVLTVVVHSLGQTKPEVDLNNLRTAKGQTLRSPALPKLQLKFDRAFKYVGGHTFILYDVARAEQHFFVDADKDGNVSRFYWIQFEGYLPSNTHQYNYRSPKTVNIGGLDFFADVYARKVDPKQGRPDSDGNRAREFLLSKGLKTASDEVMMQRLVHLLDKDKRTELMVIYLEVLTPTGLASADLAEGGKARDKWQSISEGLLQRAQSGMQIIR